MNIRAAVPEDAAWIKPIWDEKILGGFSPSWWRYWNRRVKGEFWLVINLMLLRMCSND